MLAFCILYFAQMLIIFSDSQTQETALLEQAQMGISCPAFFFGEHWAKPESPTTGDSTKVSKTNKCKQPLIFLLCAGELTFFGDLNMFISPLAPSALTCIEPVVFLPSLSVYT